MFDHDHPPIKIKSERSCMIAFIVIAVGFCLMVDILRETDQQHKNAHLSLGKGDGFLSVRSQFGHVPRMLHGASESQGSREAKRHVFFVPGNHPADFSDYDAKGTDGLGDVDDVEFSAVDIEIAYSESIPAPV
jgi:hypothetical protein